MRLPPVAWQLSGFYCLVSGFKVKIQNSLCQWLRIGFGPVGKHYDGQLLIGETGNKVAKATGAAAVMIPSMPLVRIDPPSKAIVF